MSKCDEDYIKKKTKEFIENEDFEGLEKFTLNTMSKCSNIKVKKKRKKRQTKTYGGETWNTFKMKCAAEKGITGRDIVTQAVNVCSTGWKEHKKKHGVDS